MANPYDQYFSPSQAQPAQPAQPIQQQEPAQPVESNPYAAFFTPQKTERAVELESGEWLLKDNVSTALAVLEGATLGWSDEIGVATAAAAIASTGEETYEQAYSRLKSDYDAMQKSYTARHPYAAGAAEFSGALLSPISKIGAAAKGATTITGLATRGAVEGAVYGAGKAEDTSSIADEAKKGAMFGAAAGSVLSAGGWLFKRKIEAPLDKDGVFTPITLAAQQNKTSESLLQAFYRDVVGPSFGGRGIIRGQEEAVVAPLVLKQEERIKALQNITNASKKEAAEAQAALKRSLAQVTTDTKIKAKDIEASEKIAKEVIEGNYTNFLGRDGDILARKSQQIAKSTDNAQDAFRLAAFDTSVPAGLNKRARNKILESSTPNVALFRLEQAWKEKGFQSINDTSFRLRPETLLEEIAQSLSKNSTLRLASEAGEVNTIVNRAINELDLARNASTGWVKGKDLSAIRASFGTAAASKSDAGGQSVVLQQVYRTVQDVIDKNIKKQLSPKKIESFEADKAAWATHSVLRDAVGSASSKTGVQGRFTPDQWLASIRKNSPRQLRQGEGPLRRQAEDIAAFSKKSEKEITESADVLLNKLTQRRAREINRVSNKAQAEQASLLTKEASLKNKLSSDPTAAENLAVNLKRQEELQAVIAQNASELNKINKARTLETPTWYHQLAASATAGTFSGFFGGATGGAAGIAAGVGTSRLLTTPTAQRVLAGQSAPQLAVQRAVATPLGATAVEKIAAFPRIGVGMLSEQQQQQQ